MSVRPLGASAPAGSPALPLNRQTAVSASLLLDFAQQLAELQNNATASAPRDASGGSTNPAPESRTRRGLEPDRPRAPAAQQRPVARRRSGAERSERTERTATQPRRESTNRDETREARSTDETTRSRPAADDEHATQQAQESTDDVAVATAVAAVSPVTVAVAQPQGARTPADAAASPQSSNAVTPVVDAATATSEASPTLDATAPSGQQASGRTALPTETPATPNRQSVGPVVRDVDASADTALSAAPASDPTAARPQGQTQVAAVASTASTTADETTSPQQPMTSAQVEAAATSETRRPTAQRAAARVPSSTNSSSHVAAATARQETSGTQRPDTPPVPSAAVAGTATVTPAPGEGSGRVSSASTSAQRVDAAAGLTGPRLRGIRPALRPGRAAAQPPAVDREAVTEQLADHLRLQIRRGARRARLQLRPAELGSVDVRLHMGREGLQAELRLERPEVAQAVRHSLGELRAALESARLPVGRLEVQLATPDGFVATGGGASPGGHQASTSSHNGGEGGAAGGSAAAHESRSRSSTSDSSAPGRLETRAPGRLDLIA